MHYYQGAHLLFLTKVLNCLLPFSCPDTQVSLGPGAGGGANAAQMRNIALCSQLQEVHRSLVTLLPRLPAPAAAALSTPLEALQATAIDTGRSDERSPVCVVAEHM
jgi:hypothetical protein